jgi:hypothetical protein
MGLRYQDEVEIRVNNLKVKESEGVGVQWHSEEPVIQDGLVRPAEQHLARKSPLALCKALMGHVARHGAVSVDRRRSHVLDSCYKLGSPCSSPASRMLGREARASLESASPR